MIFYLDINPHPEIINVGACTIGGVAIPLSGIQNLLTQRQEQIDALQNQIIARRYMNSKAITITTMKIIRPQTEFLTIGLIKLRPDTEKRNQKRVREIENGFG